MKIKKNYKLLIIFTLSIIFGASSVFAATFTTEFTNSANYTNDSEIEVTGGLASLKETSILNELRGYWKMDDFAGQVTDSSGNANHGTNIGGASYGASGKLNDAMSFDGIDDLINLGSDASLTTIVNNFTFGAWIKATTTHQIDTESTAGAGGVSGQKYVFSPEHGGGGSAGAGVSVGTNGISVYEHGNSYLPALAVYSAVLGTDWNHILITYTSKQPRIYLNGVLVHTGLVSPRSNVNISRGIGGYVYGYFPGEIDEAVIFNRVLTASEITELYNAGNGKELTEYENGTFEITKTLGNTDALLSSFTDFSVAEGTVDGTLNYQLSNDGITWKYWDGVAWSDVINLVDYNSETDINTNIGTFSTTGNSIYVKTFITGDGNQEVEINQITITYNTNVSPTDIFLSNNTQDENTTTHTTIGSLTTIDADIGDTHVYSFNCTVPGIDDTHFNISVDSLQNAVVFDYETKDTYNICIRTEDSEGAIYDKNFIINVIDKTETSSSKKGGSKRISKEKLEEIFGNKDVELKEIGGLCEASIFLHENMKAGDRNGTYSGWQKGTITEVKILQAHMNRLDFNSGEVDGILGRITEGAIKRMQKSLGFDNNLIDGYVGPLTREKINKSC